MSVLHLAGWENLALAAARVIDGEATADTVTLVRWPAASSGRLTKWHLPGPFKVPHVSVNGVPFAHEGERVTVPMRCGVALTDDDVAEWNIEKVDVLVDHGWRWWDRDLIEDTCGVCLHLLPQDRLHVILRADGAQAVEALDRAARIVEDMR